MQKTKIDWGIPNLYTWNPVTGCKRGCSYCYARRIHERFNKTPFSKIVFHPDRLEEPLRKKEPSTIFVGSMSDIEYWDRVDFVLILNICALCPQHIFMFLSKASEPYEPHTWPENSMQGLTITKFGPEECEKIYRMTIRPRPFLSIEPLLGILHHQIPSRFRRVIVGAMTGPGAIVPQKEWIESIKATVPKEKLYWKPSIRKYL